MKINLNNVNKIDSVSYFLLSVVSIIMTVVWAFVLQKMCDGMIGKEINQEQNWYDRFKNVLHRGL